MDLIETVDPHPTNSGFVRRHPGGRDRGVPDARARPAAPAAEVHLDLEPRAWEATSRLNLCNAWRACSRQERRLPSAPPAAGASAPSPIPTRPSSPSPPRVTCSTASPRAPIGARTERWLSGDHLWTLVGCGTRPSAVLLLQGDWMRAAPALSLLTRNLRLAWQAHVSGARADRRRLAQQLARSLARVRGSRRCGTRSSRRWRRPSTRAPARWPCPTAPSVTSRSCPRMAIRASSWSTCASIPGVGVVGAVFQSGRALYVPGRGALPEGHRRRPRYATDSFVAVPVGPAHEPLGVVCVTDRRDGQPFTRDDVSTLRAMAAPAALALGRERALAQAENYAHAAAIDPLSGAFNRRYFHARLDEELQRSRRHQLSLTLLMIDVDDFKSINDSFGHLAGDTVIRDIAEILRRSVRIFDVCARFGGEEFAIIMPGSMAESAAKVADRIRERIEAYRPFDRALEAMRVTASVGLAESSVAMSGRELIARADYALYRAKRDGKNRVRTLGPDETIHPSGSQNFEVRTTKDTDADEGR